MSQTQLNGKVVFQDNDDYNAVDLRKMVTNIQVGPGVDSYSSLLPGVVSGLTMSFTPGAGYVRQPGDNTLYRCTQEGSSANIILDANPSGNPRIDQLVLHVYDASAAGDSSAQYLAAIENINGTPTTGATLDNRSGAPDLNVALATAKAYILLADVLMPAGASTVSAGNIRDRRPFGTRGSVPPLNAAANAAALHDIVNFEPGPGATVQPTLIDGAFVSQNQSAALWWLPREIPATHLRWHYIQGGISTASADGSGSTTANYRIVICDASGRLVADTGVAGLSGADGVDVVVVRALTVPYSGFVFDVGAYYVWFGVSTISANKGIYYRGIRAGGIANGGMGAYGPEQNPTTYNQFVWANSGSTTFPASGHIKGMTDVMISGVKSIVLPSPQTALSIG